MVQILGECEHVEGGKEETSLGSQEHQFEWFGDGDQLGGVCVLLVEVRGNECRVRDGDAGVGVVDGWKGVKWRSVLTGGGESTDLLASWFDVGVLDSFGGVWDALVIEGASWMRVRERCGRLDESSRCLGTKRR